MVKEADIKNSEPTSDAQPTTPAIPASWQVLELLKDISEKHTVLSGQVNLVLQNKDNAPISLLDESKSLDGESVMEKRVDQIEQKIGSMDAAINGLKSSISDIDHKIDRIADKIDNQYKFFEKDLKHNSLEIQVKISESKVDTVKWTVAFVLGLPSIVWAIFQIVKFTSH